ncbi:DnaB-like helicase C-terminal domain-containing protein [Solibacillus sp. FSL H8-0523]|uniref:DnaB-like helicase C-terminal domain-containing protein n=1 Tax=Solibacillus sp. FSL H8-0523 TaxID=2954511 RepID=UPI0031017ECD
MKKAFLEQSILGTMLEVNDQEFSAIFTSKTSRSLKQMAKEFNCPIVCQSQLNRNVKARGNKRP